MKILITGINGFVGSHMVDYLLKNQDVEIYGIKRWHHSNLENIKHNLDKITLYDCDFTDFFSCFELIKDIKPDVIFHFGAESFVSESWKHPIEYMNVNYNGTVNLLEACRKNDINPVFHIPGSGEEYGLVHEDELPIKPDHVCRPANPYAVTKIAQDFIGSVYYMSYGCNVIRTRAFNHEGTRRSNVFGIPSYCYQIARIEKGLQGNVIHTGYTGDKRNFTDVRDMVRAYWLATENCVPGKLYLIGNMNKSSFHTFKEAIDVLLSFTDLKDISIVEKKEFVRLTNVPFLYGDTKEFERKTGWKPVIDFETTLRDMLNYWRDKI